MKIAGVAFVHVPRAAGTSVNDAVYGQFLGHFPVRALLAAGDDVLIRLPRFAIVRNPFDRLVSAYQFAIEGRGEGGKIPVNFLQAHLRDDPDFATFATFVERWLPRQNPRRIDGVFRPQSYYLRADDGSVPFDHLGRMEDLKPTAAWLSETLGRSISLPRSNRTNRPQHHVMFTPSMQAVVRQFYKEDLERFGYHF